LFERGIIPHIAFGKGTLQVPIEFLMVVFVFFQSLEFFDKIAFEFGTYPCSKFKANTTVGKGSPIATGS
jgi:hypothetical protein